MPSFDVVSEVDKHELTNAVDQARRDLGNRYDLRGTDARFELLADVWIEAREKAGKSGLNRDK